MYDYQKNPETFLREINKENYILSGVLLFLLFCIIVMENRKGHSK